MGYGFVEFRSSETASKALKTMQGTVVDRHTLQLKPSTKKLSSEKKAPRKAKNVSKKLLVRNVAFEVKVIACILDVFVVISKDQTCSIDDGKRTSRTFHLIWKAKKVTYAKEI